MSEEQNPSSKKGRVLGRQLPGILQGGGPVMIFGARPLSSKKCIEKSTLSTGLQMLCPMGLLIRLLTSVKSRTSRVIGM